MRDFKNLLIWQRSHALTLQIYKVTSSYPSSELYGMTSQMRRSASSIPTNIAEGSGRNSKAELRQFLVIAAGSSSELEYQIVLSKDLRYMDEKLSQELTIEICAIRKMIYSFIQKLS